MTRAAPGGAQPLVAAHDVAVRFGTRVALAGASFALPAGTIAVVVGPNGAGKTTLLRVLAGTLPPTTGRIDWPNGETPGRVALVGQTVALYPYLTVRENCLAAGRMEGLRGAALRARVEAVLDQALCRTVEHQQAGRLSGGFGRRAAIAAAITGDATLVVLDEPTTALDEVGTSAVVATVRALRDTGKTVVIATHDFAFADAVADLALFLRDGCLEAVDAPATLCRRLFPEATHVEITPAEPHGSDASDLFARLGAQRRSGAVYSLLSPVDAGGCPVVLEQLAAARIVVRETRIRDPGMALLFERFCGDPGPSP